jgi:hypothetical protein
MLYLFTGILGLFNRAFSFSHYIASNDRVMRRKQPWPTLRAYSSLYPVGLKKITVSIPCFQTKI